MKRVLINYIYYDMSNKVTWEVWLNVDLKLRYKFEYITHLVIKNHLWNGIVDLK